MGKIFNTTGVCRPDRHYMVNIDKRLNEIEELIAQGAYFTINRAWQSFAAEFYEEAGRLACEGFPECAM